MTQYLMIFFLINIRKLIYESRIFKFERVIIASILQHANSLGSAYLIDSYQKSGEFISKISHINEHAIFLEFLSFYNMMLHSFAKKFTLKVTFMNGWNYLNKNSYCVQDRTLSPEVWSFLEILFNFTTS